MKIILLEDVKKLGKKGEVVEVSDGYARNFVLPKKLGVEANGKNMNDLKLQNANKEKKEQENLDAAKAMAELMEKDQVTVSIKAGEGGRTFGSVSSKEIARSYKEQCGREIDKKKIVIKDQIKNIGEYTVELRLFEGVVAKLKLNIIAE